MDAGALATLPRAMLDERVVRRELVAAVAEIALDSGLVTVIPANRFRFKVPGIDAARVVAEVIRKPAGWNRPTIQNDGDPMDQDQPAVDAK